MVAQDGGEVGFDWDGSRGAFFAGYLADSAADLFAGDLQGAGFFVPVVPL